MISDIIERLEKAAIATAAIPFGTGKPLPWDTIHENTRNWHRRLARAAADSFSDEQVRA